MRTKKLLSVLALLGILFCFAACDATSTADTSNEATNAIVPSQKSESNQSPYLPKGEASRIELVSSHYNDIYEDCSFEYVNETTVKITYNGSVSYMPTSSIHRIYVK